MMVTENEIVDVSNAVWQAMLGMEAYALDPLTPLTGGPFVTATVLITDAVEGGVTLHMSASLGRALAAIMFCVEPDAVTAEDMIDAIGELANMLGGNLKALMRQPARLSLPLVTEGNSYKVSFPGAIVMNHVALGFEGHVAHIVLHERDDVELLGSYESQRSVA